MFCVITIKCKIMRKVLYILAVGSLLMTTACAKKIPYTTSVQDKYNLGEQEIKLLQFYLAGDITMYNGSRDGSTQTEGGELVIKDEQNLNKVVIPNGTRGVVEEVENNMLYVSFEVGKNIKFKASDIDGKYRIEPLKRDDQNRAVVNYGGEEYLASTTSLKAYLMFKLKNSTRRRSTQKTVKGRKL